MIDVGRLKQIKERHLATMPPGRNPMDWIVPVRTAELVAIIDALVELAERDR